MIERPTKSRHISLQGDGKRKQRKEYLLVMARRNNLPDRQHTIKDSGTVEKGGSGLNVLLCASRQENKSRTDDGATSARCAGTDERDGAESDSQQHYPTNNTSVRLVRENGYEHGVGRRERQNDTAEEVKPCPGCAQWKKFNLFGDQLFCTRSMNILYASAIIGLFVVTRNVFVLRFLPLLVISNIVAVALRWVRYFKSSPSFSTLVGINRTVKRIVLYQYQKTQDAERHWIRRKTELFVVGCYHEALQYFYQWYYYSE